MQIITADNVGVAVEKILDYLEDTNEARGIYFDGWEGLGASAVLRAVAERLTLPNITTPGLKFEKIICIDCSMWKSRRSMQRKIAEELEIPKAKDMLDRQDDEDDFNGIDKSSRAETKDVARAINDFLMGQRFLAIFHNGSDNETDITSLGLPLSQLYKGNKMLWTFRGRFRLSPKIQDRVQNTDVFLCAQFRNQGLQELWWDLLCEESKEVGLYTSTHGVNLNPTTVAKCWLYISKLNCIGSHIIDYDWNVHASNYWVCDGIISSGKDIQAWEVGDFLLQEMRKEWDDPGLHYLMGNADHWISATYFISDNWGVLPFSAVAQTVSSLFMAAQQLDSEEHYTFKNLEYFGMLKLDRASLFHNYNDMFQHSENLKVLKLSRCAFRFASPPFLCCCNLTFLGLDYCQNLNIFGEEEVQSWTCFRSLWVLDLHYTQWILSQKMIDHMDNLRELNVKGANPCNISHIWRWQSSIRKLRVIKPTHNHSEATAGDKDSVSFSHMEKMELLDLSGNTAMQAFPDLSRATSLKTVIVDGCVGLEDVSTGSLPASLEAFSLDGASPEGRKDAAKVSKISLRGCSRLKNLLFNRLPNLEELDLSGTAVKTLDLRTLEAPKLKRLFLLGCLRLRAVRWPDDGNPQLDELQVDTTGVHLDGSPRRHSSFPVQQVDDELFQSHIVVRDARLLRSLQLFARLMHYILLCISSTATDCSEDEGASNDNCIGQYCSSEQPINRQPDGSAAANKYNDIFDRVAEASAVPVMWPCPQMPLPPKRHGGCKVEIVSSSELQGSDNNLAQFIDVVDSLYVHDDFWRSSIPGSNLGWLKWCRVERCPRLHSVFTLGDCDQLTAFSWLETFWASHLQTAHCIWSKGSNPVHVDSFKRLQYIHLDSCPRLIHVLPLSFNLPNLETIQIVYCSNLRQVFPLNTRHPKEIVTGGSINFPKLRRIHLHELPKLQQICEVKIMSTPMLETIKIKGCWSLRHLPAVVGWREHRPMVDCEKDWWDNLEWDRREDGHHASLYDPRHPPCYKKALPRVSVLR